MDTRLTHIRTAAGPTAVLHAPRRTAAAALGRSHSATAAPRTRKPTVTQLMIVTATLLVGIGVLVWQLAGREVEGAVAGGVVTVGLALLVGSYASVFVSWRKD